MTMGFAQLSDIADIVMGQSPPGTSYNAQGKGMPLLNGPTEFGPIHPAEKQWTTSPTKICEPGDVLFCVRGATAGRLNVADKRYCLGRGLAAIRGKNGRLDTRFLRHVLANGYKIFQARGVGSTFINISSSDLSRFDIPELPLQEQRRVASILDQADALRAKRRAVLAELASLSRSVFIDMFGDPIANSQGWLRAPLRELGRVVTGSTPPTDDPGMFGGTVPFITPGDLESGEPVKRTLTAAGERVSTTVGPGATLVCCIGATIGKVGITAVRSAFNQQINAVEWGDAVDSLYGFAVLQFLKRNIVSWGASTTLPILKKSLFERVEIPLPPRREQQKFSRIFVHLDTLRVSNWESLKLCDELFTALQARAFQRQL